MVHRAIVSNGYAIAMAENSCLCVACGEDLTHKVGERRNILGSNSETIKELWESLFSSLLSSRVIPAAIKSSAKMCRKCYAAYERLLKVSKTEMQSFVNILCNAL